MKCTLSRALVGLIAASALTLAAGCKKEKAADKTPATGSAAAKGSAAGAASTTPKQKPIHVAYYAIPG